MEGVHRFLSRVFRLFAMDISDEVPTAEQQRLLHLTIRKVVKYFLIVFIVAGSDEVGSKKADCCLNQLICFALGR